MEGFLCQEGLTAVVGWFATGFGGGVGPAGGAVARGEDGVWAQAGLGCLIRLHAHTYVCDGET